MSRKKISHRPHLRSTCVFLFIILAFLYTSFKLINVEISRANTVDKRIQEEYFATRGNIYDRNGVTLSTTVSRKRLIVDPTKVTQTNEKFISNLTNIITITSSTKYLLLNSLDKKDVHYIIAKNEVSDSEIKSLEKNPIPGVYLETYSKRVQTNENLTGPVVGFVGQDNKGLSGIEQYLNSELQGKKGITISTKAGGGMNIPSSEKIIQKAENGQDIYLSIDRNIQFKTMEALKEKVKDTNALGGVAIIADVRTGEIIALADIDGSKNGGDPKGAASTSRSRATSLVYEPGSTHKAITVGTAIEKGTVKPSTKFMVPYSLKFDNDYKIEDSEYHSTHEMTVQEIVRDSSNIGTIKVSNTLDKNDLFNMQKKFSFGIQTSLELPGEEGGILINPKDYTQTSRPTISIGNGVAVTPIQMLSVYMTIANGGIHVNPTLIKDMNKDSSGKRILSEKTVNRLKPMLQDVVQSGTGEGASIEGYTVAGKTGTARKAPYFKPPYKYVASFVGFAPVDNPRYAAIVILDEPKGDYYGGVVAAPVFSKIMQDVLVSSEVSPSTTNNGGK